MPVVVGSNPIGHPISSRFRRKPWRPPAVSGQTNGRRGKVRSSALRFAPISQISRPPCERCSGAFSIMVLTSCKPSWPPARASRGSYRYSGGKVRIEDAVTYGGVRTLTACPPSDSPNKPPPAPPPTLPPPPSPTPFPTTPQPPAPQHS